jgi:hypothetical protein
MAITTKTKIENYEYENSYIMVSGLNYDKERCSFGVNIYADSTKKQFIHFSTYSILLNEASGYVNQAYLYLKTLPEYADAIDC